MKKTFAAKTFRPNTFANGTWNGGGARFGVAPGLEFTLGDQLDYTFKPSKAHYSISDNKLHYSQSDNE